MQRNAKKRPAPGKGRAGNANEQNNTGCRCKVQACFPELHGFPPPPAPGEGPLSDYLEARSGWHDRKTPCAALSIDDREARDQSEHSGGKIIFGSGRGQGLKHIRHADAWEVRHARRNSATAPRPICAVQRKSNPRLRESGVCCEAPQSNA